VKVKVLFFAALREQLGLSQEEMNLPESVDSLDKLKNHLRGRGGAFEKAFGGKALVRGDVNQEMAQPGAAIKAGDEVAFFPPVTGG
jgi:molybdopterin synthase sulfur carrier subunit